MTTRINNFKIPEVVINAELFMRYRFYRMFDPNSKNIKNWNIYQLVFITFTAVAQLVVLYGSFGFIVEMEDTLANIELYILMGVHIENYILLMKMIVILYNANSIWELFDVTRFNFLTSEHCCKNNKLLVKYRDVSIKLTNIYSFCTYVMMTQWTLYPTLINTFMPNGNNQRLENICNFRFPVNLQNYNQNYIIFWAMEMVVSIFFGYGFLAFDVLLISFCYAIKGQYEVLTEAFEEIGIESELSKGRYRFIYT